MATQTDAVDASRLPALLDTFFCDQHRGGRRWDDGVLRARHGRPYRRDAGLGPDSHAGLNVVFEQYMPTWAPPARSNASKILAGEQSDTPTYSRNPTDISNMNTIAPTIRAGLTAEGISAGEVRT